MIAPGSSFPLNTACFTDANQAGNSQGAFDTSVVMWSENVFGRKGMCLTDANLGQRTQDESFFLKSTD